MIVQVSTANFLITIGDLIGDVAIYWLCPEWESQSCVTVFSVQKIEAFSK